MQINITNSGQTLPVEAGSNLYQELAQAGLLDAACGGVGRCGKCRVRYAGNCPEPQQQETKLLTTAELAAGWRLACLQQVRGAIEIELPQQRQPSVVSTFWGETAALAPDDALAGGYGLAVDIGTTTLAATLIDLGDGAVLASSSCLNSQKAFGQDVISRISYAQTLSAATGQMQAAIVGDIKNLLNDICALSGLHSTEISLVSVAANPTMTHLLAGINPKPLGHAPYNMVIDGALCLPAQELGLQLADAATVYCLPATAAYLGGDIIGGMLAVGLDKPGSTRLFIDIGTNGEIVLAQGDKLFACSTAVGPALEGMNIQCGMRAATGAIDHVNITGAAVSFTTIDHAAPLGLAGSGLLTAVSELLLAGLLNKNGRLQQKKPICEQQGQRCLVIDEAANIILTQADLRQVQLAKGAILAGITALLSVVGCQAQDVDQVLVAGGFGAHLPEQSLLNTGLLPREFAGKIQYVGNASLAGAQICLLSAAMRKRAQQVASAINYVDLAQLPEYQKYFMSAMFFN